MIISIIQPGFMPWLGFFEQMDSADCFVYLDDVQYTRKDWRNRNRFKSPNGIKMISVPVRKEPSGRRMMIKEALINYDHPWQKQVMAKLENWYKKADYFSDISAEVENIIAKNHKFLIDLNKDLVDLFSKMLNITTPVYFASDIRKTDVEKNRRIIEICRYYGADILYDGKSAQNFIDTQLFLQNGISVVFQDYVHPQYPQLWGEFISHLSVLDLLMNCGEKSGSILRRSFNMELRQKKYKKQGK